MMDVPGDRSWKENVAFTINYDSGQSSDDSSGEVVVRRRAAPAASARRLLEDGGDGAPADLLGTTPPRARIRDKEKRRSILFESDTQRLLKDTRRNTMYNLRPGLEPVDRLKKRGSMKTLRARERDAKSETGRADSLPHAPAPPTLVESCSRFMCLSSRLKCGAAAAAPPAPPAPPAGPGPGPGPGPPAEPAQSREDFHRTFCLLINMGSADKGCRRTISREEQVWQNELKDLIWLEVKARVAGRSPARQDAVLCAQRAVVPTVVQNIMHYSFVNTSPCPAQDADDARGDAAPYACVQLWCGACSGALSKGLREAATLLDSFHNAVALYPSSQAMTQAHPLVATRLFQDRLKALVLWYNMSLRMRVALSMLRRLLRRPERRGVQSDAPPGEDGAPAGGGGGEGGADSDKDPPDQACDTPEILVEACEPTASADSGYASGGRAASAAGPHGADGGDGGDGADGAEGAEGGAWRLPAAADMHAAGAPGGLADGLVDKTAVSPFRAYLDDMLKTQGVRKCLKFAGTLRALLRDVHETLRPAQGTPAEDLDEEAELEPADLLDTQDPRDPREAPGEDPRPDGAGAFDSEDAKNTYELRRYGALSPEARAMRLPSYRGPLLLLSTLCLDAVHDYLALRLERRPRAPSCLTIQQMIHELKEGLDIATDTRAAHVRCVRAALGGRRAPAAHRAQLRAHVDTFDDTVEEVITQYLSHLRQLSRGQALPRAALQLEWRFSRRLALRVRRVALLAPPAFTDIACNQSRLVLGQLRERFQQLREGDAAAADDTTRQLEYGLTRRAVQLYADGREAALAAAAAARTLAAALAADARWLSLRERLYESLMSLRDCIADQIQVILQHCQAGGGGAGGGSGGAGGGGEAWQPQVRLVLLKMYMLGFELHKELYKFLSAGARPRRPASLPAGPGGAGGAGGGSGGAGGGSGGAARRRPETLYVHDAVNPLMHKELHKMSGHAGADGGGGLLARADTQPSIELLLWDAARPPAADPAAACLEPAARLVHERWTVEVSRAIVSFARCWMRFVTAWCERGRGLRPRWAHQGLEFLMLACDPANTRHLGDAEFEELKSSMDACISHVIGSRPPRALPPPAAHARGKSPLRSPRASPRLHVEPPAAPAPAPCETPPAPPALPAPPTPPTPPGEPDPVLHYHGLEDEGSAWARRVSAAARAADAGRARALAARGAVGRVVAAQRYEPRLRRVTFKWQRGLKIGQGTFGKVYTVLNTESSRLLAMKEVAVCAGDRRGLERAANELRVLEGVTHRHLVQHYGAELHREQLLIFMELCVEGSLEALLAAGALPERSVRLYTKQLVAAVRALHDRAIAHRDIKPGNIFLTNRGNCIKLGDFGCAVRIRAEATAAGELLGAVGTQAYMAPEVFMKASGHGRAADVWSLGCVVTEMASGRRPFAECDSNYQIMFKVGMGCRPEAPAALSAEGHAFCALCLAHEPSRRPKADELSTHHFLMVEEVSCCDPNFSAKDKSDS